MVRHKYVLSEDEIRTLMSGVINLGAKDTYSKMKERMLASIDQGQEADEICMDMYEGMLNRARTFGADNEDKSTTDIRQTLYQIASMLRTLAHEMHKICKNKFCKDKDGSKRFLEIASYNPGVNIDWHK
jgi:hypothetical protein